MTPTYDVGPGSVHDLPNARSAMDAGRPRPLPPDDGDWVHVPAEGFSWWGEGIAFALSYNGYQRHPDCTGAARRLWERFTAGEELPDDIGELRAALFWEQRRIRHVEEGDPLRDEAAGLFLEAVVRRIRELGGEWLPGPSDPPP